MTSWGALLLVSYVGLGLSRLERARALTYAVALTVLILTLVRLRAG